MKKRKTLPPPIYRYLHENIKAIAIATCLFYVTTPVTHRFCASNSHFHRSRPKNSDHDARSIFYDYGSNWSLHQLIPQVTAFSTSITFVSSRINGGGETDTFTSSGKLFYFHPSSHTHVTTRSNSNDAITNSCHRYNHHTGYFTSYTYGSGERNIIGDRCPYHYGFTTSLQMGLRSFMKNRIQKELLRNEGTSNSKDEKPIDRIFGSLENKDEEDTLNHDESTENIVPSSLLDAPNVLDDEPSPMDTSQGEELVKKNEASNPVSHSLKRTKARGERYGETVKERITRVKSGSMTDEEKEAFLNTALTFKIPKSIDSPKPYREGPPIRQIIPDVDKEEFSNKPTSPKNTESYTILHPSVSPMNDSMHNSKVAPFPTDSLWSTVIGKGKADAISDGTGRGGDSKSSSSIGGGREEGRPTMADSAKRQYLEMVTNPNRFDGYAVMGGVIGGNNAGKSSTNDEVQVESNDSNNVAQDNLHEKINSDQAMLSNEKEDSAPLETGKTHQSTGLAARLERAAMLQVAREKKEKKRRDIEREEQIRAQVAARERQEQKRLEELRRQEEELAAKRRAEEEKVKKEKEKKRAEEAERMKVLIAKQDEYWKKQLEKETEKNSQLHSSQMETGTGHLKSKEVQGTKQVDVESEHNRLMEEIENKLSKKPSRDTQLMEQIRTEQRRREGHREDNILQKAADDDLRERKRNLDIVDESVARISRTVPLKNTKKDVSVSAFVTEQNKKREALNKLIQEQQKKLKSLNSPIAASIQRGLSPNIGKVNTVSDRQKPNVSDANKAGGNSASSKTVISSSTTQHQAKTLNLNNLTMNKNLSQSKDPIQDNEKLKPLVSSIASPNSVDNTPRLSLAKMTMLKNDNTSAKNTPPKPSTPPPKKGPIRQRVVRQSIPLNDEDEDDFYQFDRSGENKKMSIKEIMEARNGGGESKEGDKKQEAKAKSMMWGIDIDKFK